MPRLGAGSRGTAEKVPNLFYDFAVSESSAHEMLLRFVV